MDFSNITKGQEIDFSSISKQDPAIGPAQYYIGTGWDFEGSPVDLDLVAALCEGGKITEEKNLVFFNNRNRPGVQLSEDNRSGEGDGDDENIIIDTYKLDSKIDSIVFGIIAFSSGTDFSNVKNPHLRICDGPASTNDQLFDFPIQEKASPGQTVLVAGQLSKSPDGQWSFKAIGDFFAAPNQGAALNAFAEKAQAISVA